MKKTLLSLAFALFVLCSHAQEYAFNHGPYLQELTTDGATVVFTTSRKGFSWIEVRTPDGQVQTRYDLQDGLRNANNTFNTIRIDALTPASEYSYRLVSKEIADFQPYKVTFGDSIASPWYDFRTLDPAMKRFSFIAVSDIHQESEKLRTLLGYADINSALMAFYVGDMMNYYDKEETPYKGFIDTSVELFASEKPFVLVRGNHETRGALARQYHQFVPNRSGKFYGCYQVGEVMFVILDGGEDKEDTHPVYAGLIDFDTYRTEQAQWLKTVVAGKAFKKAKYRVVMSHFPPYATRESVDHGMQEINDKIMPILNGANIDVMFCGHTHVYEMMPVEKGRNNFPIVIGSNKSISRVDVDEKSMKIKVLDTTGQTLGEYTIDKK